MKLLKRVGVQGLGFLPSSLRAGGATYLYLCGEDVERLRMASPFCQGREDSYFSPQDVEIVKDAVDDKVKNSTTNYLTTRSMVYMGHPI